MIPGCGPRRRGNWPVKQTFLLHPRFAGAGPALLSLSLSFLAGCSGGEASLAESNERFVEKYGVERSEYVALKKANPKKKDLEKALLKQELERLKAEGVVVKSTAPAKRHK
jgi:hypothetical protein